MNKDKLTMPERILLGIGSLLVSMSFLLNEWLHIPDFFRGIMLGTAIGLELAAVIIMVKRRRNKQASC